LVNLASCNLFMLCLSLQSNHKFNRNMCQQVLTVLSADAILGHLGQLELVHALLVPAQRCNNMRMCQQVLRVLSANASLVPELVQALLVPASISTTCMNSALTCVSRCYKCFSDGHLGQTTC
jgi:hypothetical protein